MDIHGKQQQHIETQEKDVQYAPVHYVHLSLKKHFFIMLDKSFQILSGVIEVLICHHMN